MFLTYVCFWLFKETASDGAETDIIRFQREELFKHNALSDCKQKLTVTVKACSEPGVSF